MTIKEIKAMYVILDKLIRDKAFDEIDILLMQFQSLNIKIAILRYTYLIRDSISRDTKSSKMLKIQ